MVQINSPQDATVRQLRQTIRDVATIKRFVDAKRGNDKKTEKSVVQIGQVVSTTAEDNTTLIKFLEFSFDTAAVPNRQPPTFKDSGRPNIAAIALGGQSYETGEQVIIVKWRLRWYILRRLDGDLWFGTTSSIIAQGGSGTVDVLTYTGTISRTAHDYFGEQIGNNVKVVGCYAPDGKNYVLAAACEADPSAGITNPIPNP